MYTYFRIAASSNCSKSVSIGKYNS